MYAIITTAPFKISVRFANALSLESQHTLASHSLCAHSKGEADFVREGTNSDTPPNCSERDPNI